MSSQRHKISVTGVASNGEPRQQGAENPFLVAPPETPAPARTFPIGPFNLLAIEAAAGGINYCLSEADGMSMGLQTGDRLRAEATGDAEANGEFNLTAVNFDGTTVRIFRAGIDIDTPVELKGRISVIGPGG